MLTAPAGHRQVTLVSQAIASFFVGIQRCEWGQKMQPLKHGIHITCHDPQPAAFLPQLGVKVTQALDQELIVLARRVRCCPQAGLNHIKTQHRPRASGMKKRRVVLNA